MGNCVCCSVACLTEDEYLLLKGPTARSLSNGPGCKCYPCWQSGTKLPGIVLTENEFLVTENEISGQYLVYPGPMLYKPSDPYEKPRRDKERQIILQNDQYAVIINTNTGERKSIKGPAKYLPGAYETCPAGPQKKIILTTTQYVHVKDHESGKVTTLVGPLFYEPGPYEERLGEIRDKISLNHYQYIRVLDQRTGVTKIVRGPEHFAPKYEESILEGPSNGVNIDEHTAVTVRDTSNGSIWQVTERQLFIPSAMEKIEQVQRKIVLQEFEVMIIVDKEGNYHIKDGRNLDDRVFFMPPYCSVFFQEWSTDAEKNHDKYITVERFDLRPSYMNYLFLIRTKDNVELEVDCAFYWQILDVMLVITHTADPPGDVCNHARSIIVEYCSRVTLESFISSYNQIFQTALEQTESFYLKRGIKVHRVQVLKIRCKDDRTETVLQEIIQETTNRINNRQKQESRNEVRLCELQGQIDEEKMKGELLSIRHQHMRNEAEMEGQSEADRVTAFLSSMPAELTMEQKIMFFESLRTVEKVDMVCSKSNVMYVTPEQCELKISRHENVGASTPRPYVSKNEFAYNT